MIRTFHPVGQGAFYSEEFFDANGKAVFRVVYDCGSSKYCKLQSNIGGSPLNRSDIEKRVENAFNKTDIIDLLFVSHFDSDHVNLISRLRPFKSRHHIRRVVLPLLSAEERYMLTGAYLLSDELRGDAEQREIIINMINSPETYFGSCEKIVFVRPEVWNDERSKREYPHERIAFEDLTGVIPSQSEIVIAKRNPVEKHTSDWIFSPYNHKPERYHDLKMALEGSFNREGRAFELKMLKDVKFVDENLVALRRCYACLHDGVNRNSMVLYSGPNVITSNVPAGALHRMGDSRRDCWMGRYLWQMMGCCMRCCTSRGGAFHPVFASRPGCLYTGDLSLRDAQLTRRFKKFSSNIGIVQLPHHGSQDSFGDGDLPMMGRACVATYGEKNSYGHPALSVKRVVAKQAGFWVDVTELDASQFEIKYRV